MNSSNGTHECRPNNSRKVAADHFVIRLEDIPYIVWYDLTYGMLWFGKMLVRNNGKGVTQGSPLSPGIASVVCCYLQWKHTSLFINNSKIMFHGHAIFALQLVMRYVDDIYMRITFMTNLQAMQRMNIQSECCSFLRGL